MAAGNTEKTVTMIARQNYEALLMDYAAGSLSEGQSLVVAAHLTLSPYARTIVQHCEMIGGGLLDSQCKPVQMKETSLQSVLDRIETRKTERSSPCKPHCCDNITALKLPVAVLRYLENTPAIGWKTLYPGIHSFEIKTSCRYSKVRLLKIDPGTRSPEHTHGGTEITLLIEGAVHDQTGTYKRGDLIVMDQTVTHQPVADKKPGCVCLVVNNDPIRLTGWLGNLLNPFLRR